MTRPTGPRDAVTGSGRKVVIEFRPRGLPFAVSGIASMVRAMDVATRPFVEGRRRLRALTEQVSAVRATEKALDDLPKCILLGLTVITVRCREGKLLLRVVRIPAHLPAAAYDTHLVMPTSATTYQYEDQRIAASAWFLAQHDKTSGVRCRCHPEMTLTRKQLLGESPPPPGVRVLVS